jgi:hypothetical protein
VPLAAVSPRPMQYSKVPARCRRTARAMIPATAVGPRPLRHFKVPARAEPLHLCSFHSSRSLSPTGGFQGGPGLGFPRLGYDAYFF